MVMPNRPGNLKQSHFVVGPMNMWVILRIWKVTDKIPDKSGVEIAFFYINGTLATFVQTIPTNQK